MPRKTKQSPIKKFTVYRKSWLRGGTSAEGGGVLLSSNGQKCCLGHLCRDIGIPSKVMLHRTVPSDIFNGNDYYSYNSYIYEEFAALKTAVVHKMPKRLGRPHTNPSFLWDETPLIHEITAVNDDDIINDVTREKKLRKLFKRAGVTICFSSKLESSRASKRASKTLKK